MKRRNSHKNSLTKIEQAFATKFMMDMNVDLTDRKLWPYIRQQMRLLAHHEAGHAVSRAFMQLEYSHITQVSIIPDVDFMGRVRVERAFAEITLKHLLPCMIRTTGRQLLISMLAGRAAEYRVDDSDNREDILDEDSEEWEIKGADLFRAQSISILMAKPHMPYNRILNMAEKWTNEMLDIPQVWNAIERMASILIQRGTITDSAELCELVANVPMAMKMSVWKHRLYPSEKEVDKEFDVKRRSKYVKPKAK